jgi:hypothetical protein
LTDSLYSPAPKRISPAPPSASKGDTVDINLPYADWGYRVIFWGDEIESIESIETSSGKRIQVMETAAIFPANLYIAPKDRLSEILNEIQDEMVAQEKYFVREGRLQEARRIRERTTFDLEMIKRTGLLQRHRKLLPVFRPPRARRPAVLPARLFSRRLPDDRGREPRNYPAGARHVGRRPRPQADARELWLPPALGYRQPAAQFRGIRKADQPGHFRERHTRPIMNWNRPKASWSNNSYGPPACSTRPLTCGPR